MFLFFSSLMAQSITVICRYYLQENNFPKTYVIFFLQQDLHTCPTSFFLCIRNAVLVLVNERTNNLVSHSSLVTHFIIPDEYPDLCNSKTNCKKCINHQMHQFPINNAGGISHGYGKSSSDLMLDQDLKKQYGL